MWAWMTADGPGEICEITRRMNSEEYITILEDVMLPSVRALYPEMERPQLFFMQDNCPAHTARDTMIWFEEHPEITVIEWPARSPDINPIENVWAEMVREVRSRGDLRTRADLIAAVNVSWDELRDKQENFRNLLNSLPNRLEKIITAERGWINY